MALDNLSRVGIGFPLWLVLSAMKGVCDYAAGALRDIDPTLGGL